MSTGPLTYLVTGGAGFVGSHLVEALLAQDCRVLVVDDLSTGRMENLASAVGHPHFTFALASVTDERMMDMVTAKVDVVIHLAAVVGVGLVIEHPVRVIETNVAGTRAVLKAAVRHRPRVLIASSSEVYGKGVRMPAEEEDELLLGPTSRSRWCYAASKMVDEFLALAYQQEYGLEVVPFRLFNTVGPRQSGRYGMVIPRFMQQALKGEPITVYGDGTQTRCFCDVQDVVRALIGLSTHPDAAGRVYNVGGTEEVSMNELAERVRMVAGSDSPIVRLPYADVYPHGYEDIQRRVPDTRRLRSLLGWEPRLSLDATLPRVRDYLQSVLTEL